MDPDVAQLVREQRLLEAAGTASARGDFQGASRIYEQACEWSKAAEQALHAGDGPRALRLSVFGGDNDVAARALAVVARDAAGATAAAAQLTRAGRHAWAARVFEECDRPGEAARSWERAGETRRAGAAFVQAGEAAEAARVLQTTLDQEPSRWELAVDLARLLGRLGRWDAAARVVQRIPSTARERADAVLVLVDAFDALGWSRAAAEARAEADASGAGAAASAAVAAPSPAVPRGSLFGRYAVVREVASSPRARVLECRDPVLGETVAVKVFAAIDGPAGGPEALARFAADVLALRGTRHPAVVPVREYVPQGPATVQAWMPGGDLEGMLGRFGALAPARAAEVACAVLSALAAGHEIGVLHRAVKPTNVLFDAVGGARLGDFGSAQLSDVAATVTTALSRTLAYVAPELRQGRAPTERSDVFSVGVMLHEMLTGVAPDPHLPLVPLPSQVHHGLDARHDHAVGRLAALDPMVRPDHAREAIAVLAGLVWAGSAAGHAGPGTTAEVSWRDEADRVCAAAGDAPFAELDAWIARGIERVPCTPHTLARARAFARAGDPGLQAVWKVDASSQTLWLEALGPGLDRALSDGERESLRRGLDALHAAGAVHGAIGREGVGRGAQGWVLRVGGEPHAGAGVEEDRAALAAL